MGVVVGSLGSISGTGNITVTGLAFQPVAVLFYSNINNLTPPGLCMGAATASGEQWVMWTGMDTEIGTSYAVKYNQGRTDACLLNRHPPFSTVAYQASFTTFTSDGFTINVGTYNGPVGDDITFVAIGGPNVADAKAGTFSVGSSTGTTAVTGTGFVPKALIVGHTADTWGSGVVGNFKWGVGFATASDQYAAYASSVPASTHSHIHRTDAVAAGMIGSAPFRVALDSMDSDGFTVDVTDASTGNHTFGYVAIDAAAAAVGNEVIPTSTGTQALTTPGLEAEGVMFTWTGADSPSTAGVEVNSVYIRPGVGAGTIAANRAVAATGRDNFPFGLYNVIGYTDTAAITMRGKGSGVDPTANTVYAGATMSSFAMGTADVNWGIVDAAVGTRVYGWLALPGDVEVPFAWIPQIYRRQPK